MPIQSLLAPIIRELKKWRFDADADGQRFRAALQARLRYPLATAALIGLTSAIYLLMAAGAGSSGDADTLTAWGASYGPLTTNGGWWRLVAALFVHSSLIVLLVNMGVLMQLGSVLERLVGRPTLIGTYLASGIVANLITMSSYRLVITRGGAGAICGLYGLLLASAVWTRHRPSMFSLPRARRQRMAILAGLFVVCSLANGTVSVAGQITALLLGFASGVILTRRSEEMTPSPRLVAYTMAVAAGLAIALALPLRGIADVQSTIRRVLSVEEHTAAAYQAAEKAYNNGRIGGEALADLIARTIVPELQATEQQVRAVRNVPPEQQALVENAQQYLHLRSEGWQMRIFALRKLQDTPEFRETGLDTASNARWRINAERQYRENMKRMARAESVERQSLELLQQLRAN